MNYSADHSSAIACYVYYYCDVDYIPLIDLPTVWVDIQQHVVIAVVDDVDLILPTFHRAMVYVSRKQPMHCNWDRCNHVVVVVNNFFVLLDYLVVSHYYYYYLMAFGWIVVVLPSMVVYVGERVNAWETVVAYHHCLLHYPDLFFLFEEEEDHHYHPMNYSLVDNHDDLAASYYYVEVEAID